MTNHRSSSSSNDRRTRSISIAESECSFQEIHSQLEYEEPTESETEERCMTVTDDCHDTSPRPAAAPSVFTNTPSNGAKLMLVFVLLVLFGSGNSVLNKLSAIPMYNYPNFLNLWGTLVYIPLCFLYIWPMIRFGTAISPEQLALSKRPFAIMGALDCLTCLMQTFAAVYLPGTLLVLLPQAAIPISMLLSKHLLKARYQTFQYVGAVVVLLGIVVVLEPVLTGRHNPDHVCQAIQMDHDCTICQVEIDQVACLSHRLDSDPTVIMDFEQYLQSLNTTDDDGDEGQPVCQWVASSSTTGGDGLVILWSGVMILSCLPMTLSSIYKEMALGGDLDPIYLNGWVAIFQFFFSLVLAVPAGLASSPPIAPSHVPENVWDGFQCYLGGGSIDTGCHPDVHCHDLAGLLVNLSVAFSVCTTLCAMYVLKYGSASLLYLALTLMVPIGNVAFSLLPQAAAFHLSDILGLAVIMAGLVLYRWSDSVKEEPEQSSLDPPFLFQEEEEQEQEDLTRKDLRQPLLSGDV